MTQGSSYGSGAAAHQGEQQGDDGGAAGGGALLGTSGRRGIIIMGCSKLKVVIAIVCVCSCIYVLSVVILTPWACRQIFKRSDCSQVLGLMLAKSSDPLPNHKAADLHSYIPPTTNSLTCGQQQQQQTGTDISRIVFGIASASEIWARVGGRREYVKQWWKPEMRGFVWLEKEVELEEEAVAVAAAAGGKSSSALSRGGSSREYPPFKVSQDTTHFQYTNRWGVRDALRISRIVSETFRLGLPNVDWFVMADDDTVFITHNLVQVLSKYDHSQPFYVGYASESHRENIIFSYEMAFGGAGYAISYPLAKKLTKIQDSCIQRYPHFFGGDDRIYACVAELGVPLTKEPGFHQLDIRRDALGILAAHPVTPLVSLHHLDFIPEIFPKTATKTFTKVEAVKYLLDAAAVDPASILQQSICYDRKQEWSISVSWGYVVEVYKGFISPLTLQRPARTFLSWYHENEKGTFSINTREIAVDVCQRPTRFFLEDIHGPATKLEGLMEAVFLKQEDPEQSQCDEKLIPLSMVKKICVLKEPMDSSWYQIPRRSCCRIQDWGSKQIDIHVGACREGESLLGATD